MKKIICFVTILLVALVPSMDAFAIDLSRAKEKFGETINSANESSVSNSITKLIKAITNLSTGVTKFEEAKTITSLSLEGESKEYKYTLGEKIDLNQILATLTVKFNNGEQKLVKMSEISDEDIFLRSLRNVNFGETVHYKEVKDPATYVLVLQYGYLLADSGDIFITLEEPVTLKSISIKAIPKTEYIQGESLDITGLKVEAEYSNGTIKTVENNLLNIIGFDANKIGQQTITVKFEDKTATYTVNVKEVQKPDVSEDIEIDRVVYTPKGGFTGELTVILNKPTESKLNVKDFSVHCPGLNGMTISSVSTTDNKTYLLTTPAYNDNRYILEIYLKDKTLENEFMVKSNCPVISYPYITRVSNEKALLKFNADEAGTVFYIVRENNTRLRANTGIPTENELRNGKEVKISSGPNEISIDTLKANVAYELYYMTSKNPDNPAAYRPVSVVYGPVNISSEVEKTSTSEITIVKAESKRTNTTQDITITLSQPTNEPLTLDAFEIVCPAAATLRFNEIENGIGTNKNKVYTLKMRGGFYDNNYEITIHFPDGTYTKGSFRSQLGTPSLIGFDIKRTSATTVKVIFESSMAGYIYYGFSEELYKKPPYEEVLLNGIKRKINLGKNTLILENLPNDIERFFYWIPENNAGRKQNYVEGAGDFNRIPVNITEEIPEPESKIKIEEAVVADREGITGIKFTLSEDIGSNGLSKYQITFEGDNGSLPLKYMIVDPYEYYQNKVFFIISMGWPLEKGTYTLKLVFKDGVAKKDVVLTENIN